MNPRVQGLLDLAVFVGRFGGKKVHRTFFFFHLTSSAGSVGAAATQPDPQDQRAPSSAKNCYTVLDKNVILTGNIRFTLKEIAGI